MLALDNCKICAKTMLAQHASKGFWFLWGVIKGFFGNQRQTGLSIRNSEAARFAARSRADFPVKIPTNRPELS